MHRVGCRRARVPGGLTDLYPHPDPHPNHPLTLSPSHPHPRLDPRLDPHPQVRGGLDYLYGLLHDGVPHTGENCTRWVYYDNCRDLQSARAPVVQWCKAHCAGAPCPNTLSSDFVSKPVRAEDDGRARPERRQCRNVSGAAAAIEHG